MMKNVRLKILLGILVISVVVNVFVVYKKFSEEKDGRAVVQESGSILKNRDQAETTPNFDLTKDAVLGQEFAVAPFDKATTSFVISVNDNKHDKVWYYAWSYHTNSSQLIHVLDLKEGGYKLLRPFQDGTWLTVRIPQNSQSYNNCGNDLYRVGLNDPEQADFLVGSPREMIVDATITSNDNVYFLDSDAVDGFVGSLYKFDTTLKKLEMIGEPDGGIYTMYSLEGEGRKDWEIGLRMSGGDGGGYSNGFYIANALTHTIQTVGEYSGFDGVGDAILGISPDLGSALILNSFREGDDYDADVIQSLYAVSVKDGSITTTSLWAKGFGSEHKNSKILDGSVRFATYTILLDNEDGTISLIKYDTTSKFGDQMILDHRQCPGYCYLVSESVYGGFDIIGSQTEQEHTEFYFPRDEKLEKVALPTESFLESSYKFIPMY